MELNFIKNYVESALERDITLNTRKREYVYARSLYMLLARENTKKSLEEIGKFINKDHATVLHALKNTVDEAEENDKHWKAAYKAFNAATTIDVEVEEPQDKTYGVVIDKMEDLRGMNEKLMRVNIDLVNEFNKLQNHSNTGNEAFNQIINKLNPEGQEVLLLKMEAAVNMMKQYHAA